MQDLPDQRQGMFAALGAFLFWGFLPLYFNLLSTAVSTEEVLIHRIVWVVVVLLVFELVRGRWAYFTQILRQGRTLLALSLTALLIATNWGVFIWAVTHGHVVESSLGYYINPLLNVLLGFCFLGERLRPFQLLAVLLAASGVGVMVFAFGQVPWISLLLAGSFACYGLIRKQTTVDSTTGLLIEALVLLPFALVWLTWLYHQNQIAFLHIDAWNDLLLVGTGIVTTLPLVMFAFAAKRLWLSTLGLFQYITPTAHLLTGVFLFGEAFTRADAIAFTCIWVGLAIYTADNWRQQRVAKRPSRDRISA